MRKKFVLVFPPEIVGQFIFYKLMKNFDFWVNILRAKIDYPDGGKLVLEVEGDDEKIEKGMNKAKDAGVVVTPLEDAFHWNEEVCVDCGACVSACPTQTLTFERDEKSTLKVNFLKCMACADCAQVCPTNAITIDI